MKLTKDEIEGMRETSLNANRLIAHIEALEKNIVFLNHGLSAIGCVVQDHQKTHNEQVKKLAEKDKEIEKWKAKFKELRSDVP